MVKENGMDKDAVSFEELGIRQVQEADRFQLDERGAMQITRIRFDYKTKYWNDVKKEGTPIVKFDGFDITTGERVKYFTLSRVIYKIMNDLIQEIGCVIQKDENGNDWNVLKKGVNIAGFEKVSTGVRGQNPYLKIKTKI